MTVSLHQLTNLTTQLSQLEPLGLFKSNDYPYSVSEADLEIISEFFPTPDIFLHYIEKRLEVHRLSARVSGDELDLFGAYLDTRFVNRQLWDDPTHNINGFFLDGYSAQFDQWAFARWRNLGRLPDIQLRVPSEALDFLIQLKDINTPDARRAAKSILELSNSALTLFSQSIQKIILSPPPPGTTRSFSSNIEGTLVCLVCSAAPPPPGLSEQLLYRASLEDYRIKSRRTLGFGLAINDKKTTIIDIFVREEPWRQDPQMDAFLASDRANPLPGSIMPKRNDPCFCGSGLKHKRCCLSRIRRLKTAE
ncbi:YecA family protein [Myxococcus sp. NMCA1]|uniref:YecA family protein n=1 Tax=Myxococcus sp. NMCA1 TaxID=2996785 RepID=UPI002286504D|nr:SEC-C domain-containing protein [Myxococcus sp. NMCA1]WAM24123.1 SEC-C domain-containing protein [Myxococcus sp. NMCA1]